MEPNFQGGVYPSRSVMRRIRRHAHRLARELFYRKKYNEFMATMIEQLEAGALDEPAIEQWEPDA